MIMKIYDCDYNDDDNDYDIEHHRHLHPLPHTHHHGHGEQPHQSQALRLLEQQVDQTLCKPLLAPDHMMSIIFPPKCPFSALKCTILHSI